jgi:hypothetical protein
MIKSWFPEMGICNLDMDAIHVHYTCKQCGSEISEETRLARGLESSTTSVPSTEHSLSVLFHTHQVVARRTV